MFDFFFGWPSDPPNPSLHPNPSSSHSPELEEPWRTVRWELCEDLGSYSNLTVGSYSSLANQPSSMANQQMRHLKDKRGREFENPWRKMKWEQKNFLEQQLRKFKVSHPDVWQIRILLIGPVGAGKSSFINSVNNVFQHRITSEALVAVTSGKSHTKKYQTHYIEGEYGNHLPFAFNDIMGLEAEQGSGVHVDDLIKALEGCIQEGYKFNPESRLSRKDHNYRGTPGVKDQTFCLVNILPADKVTLMDSKMFEKMKRIAEEATELDIPQMIIMTKPDEACPLVKKDLKKIYSSKKIKEKMQECSNMLGVPMNHIFPVKNYHEEVDTEDDLDYLILKALDQIVNLANDALKKKCRDEP